MTIRLGVVDCRLRVYGLANVRIVDAGILPLTLNAPPQQTVYTIAEKVCVRTDAKRQRTADIISSSGIGFDLGGSPLGLMQRPISGRKALHHFRLVDLAPSGMTFVST